jgi:hypothetical protein
MGRGLGGMVRAVWDGGGVIWSEDSVEKVIEDGSVGVSEVHGSMSSSSDCGSSVNSEMSASEVSSRIMEVIAAGAFSANKKFLL